MTDRFWEHKRSVVSTPSRSTGSTLTPDTLSCLAHPMLPNRFITRYDVNTTMKPRRPLNFQEMVGFGQGTGGLLHLVWFRCPVPRIEPTRPRPLLRDKYSGCQICGTQLRPVVKSHDQGTAVPNGIDPFLFVIHAVGSEWVDTHLFSTLKIKHRTLQNMCLFLKSIALHVCTR
ncbi:uncharacterized protein LOC135497900 isoform X1 [Lineus longissimus]|uniref:uncharacterized protein LOC135497900 isoform X1 n=1 Tax=Lineus longissimus TaxID=88925 RepID=UPI00315C9DD7